LVTIVIATGAPTKSNITHVILKTKPIAQTVPHANDKKLFTVHNSSN